MSQMQNSDLTKAIITIGTYLPTSTAITIFPFDIYTDRIMVEGHGLEVNDVVRKRIEMSLELIHSNPTAGAHMIDSIVDEIEAASRSVRSIEEEEKLRIKRNKKKKREEEIKSSLVTDNWFS